jgi:hypothetical protein
MLTAGLLLGSGLPVTAGPLEAVAPLDLPETSPIGTMSWLPVAANERPTGGNFRLVVAYDNSLDPDTGQPTDLLADGPWGMKLFSNSVIDSTGRHPAITLAAHSSHVSSLDDAGLPPELQDVDDAFIGLAGDVTSGDCDNLEGNDPSDLSYAYSTTFTLPGDVPAGDCQQIDGHIRDEETDEILFTIITEYEPGFWFDVSWPYEVDLAGDGGEGHTLSEIWYGAAPGFGDDPTAFPEATETGFSPSLRGPGDYIERYTLFDDSPSGSFPCNGSGATVTFQVPPIPEKANGIHVALYPVGDWDLQIDAEVSGNFHVNEAITLTDVVEGQQIPIEGCNFSGGSEAELIVSWI